jgi:TIR domain
MPAIFISYRRKDTGGHVGWLREELKERYGRHAVFTDFDSIQPGARYKKEIEEALDSSDIVLVVIGENWSATKAESGDAELGRRIDDHDDVLRGEIASALGREDLTVLPVLVEDADLPDAGDLPEDLVPLREFSACRLRNSEWKSDVARIRRTIDAASPKRGPRKLVARGRLAAGEHRGVVVGGLVAILAIVAALVFLIDGSGPDPVPEGCVNLGIEKDVRAELSKAAGESEPAIYGTVYYGRCHSRHWAIATFPDKTFGVFAQNGFHWHLIGADPEIKCDRIPPELLEEWSEDEYC